MTLRLPIAVLLAVALTVALVPEAGAAEPREADQWGLSLIDAPDAWATATGVGAVVAVVDTGVDRDHPELAGKLVNGASWVCPQGQPAPCSDWDDANGHGTHVAGIVAAPRDGRGVSGVAPDATIMPVRVLDEDGSGPADDVAAGIRYAVDHGADVVNLSLAALPVVAQLAGATGLDGGFMAAIEYAVDQGVLVVAAAGNEAFPICDNEDFVHRNGLCVAAVDANDLPAWYSNSALGVEVRAPGGAGLVLCGPSLDVLSTWPVDQEPFCDDQPGYEAISGTSMAAPHVAGIGALLVQLGVTGQAAADRIVATAEGPLVRVNAAQAVTGA